MQPITTLINQFYNQCFVYVKPNPRGGSTSMWELAHMGRKTIAQNQDGAPNVLEYKDINDIINLIYQEEKKIGTIQEQVSKDTQKIFMNKSDWLTLDFWRS